MLQLITIAGGLRDFADSDKIMIIRSEKGQQVIRPFNYKGVTSGKTTLTQNIELKPGDTVIVPYFCCCD